MKQILVLTSVALMLGAPATFVAGSIVINGKPVQAYPARECPCP